MNSITVLEDIRALNTSNNTVVILQEEFGYKEHIWFTGMSPAKLESFWKSIKDIEKNFFNPTAGLPGKVITVIDKDSWPEAFRSGEFYTAQIHLNSDSYLAKPNGEIILHDGYTEEHDYHDGDDDNCCD